jgi:hypothetical protein
MDAVMKPASLDEAGVKDTLLPRDIHPSWQVMVNLLAGIPCAVPAPPAPDARGTRMHRFDALSEEKN